MLGSGDERNAPPGGIQFDDLSGASWDARYAHSKLANGLFSLELSRRLAGTRATSNCVSPGHTRSNILRNVGNRYRDDARSVQQGAATPCWLAKLDSEANQQLSAQLGIRSIPSLILFKNGREVARQSGAFPLPQLMAWLRSQGI
mgnify:CR=1 FL=1